MTRLKDRSVEYDHFSGIVIVKTPKAVLIDFGDDEIWVPLSVLSLQSATEVDDAKKGDALDLAIAMWFADRELR